ncbi:MAG TPA: NAD(P)H-binding protein, partial [Nitrososphaeraceae archaeon]|nr:NAD(P)H-binding protein [Nitrososphaeraceae archaeon]
NTKQNLRILVTGATGFIGSRIVKRLLANGHYKVRCMTRNPENIYELFNLSGDIIEVVKADASNYLELVEALKEVDVAFYLIHSMEGSTKKWQEFSKRDRIAAENFAKAASETNTKRIIYLSGLIDIKHKDLSEHMQSRKEVGDILRTSKAEVTIFRAAVILGQGGGSFQMLQYLVERLPVMVCPKWVLTKSQPISVDDVVTYLIKSIELEDTANKDFDIGGPEILSYVDMMKRYSAILNKPLKIVIIPFLTPRLSSYWVDLITPVKASLARPLIDSLKHEAVVHDNEIQKLIPIKLMNFEESIKTAMKEQVRKTKIIKKQKTSDSLNRKILIFSLISLGIIGATYYFLDNKNDLFTPLWIILAIVWYFGILFALFFVKDGARLGSLVAGIIGWITLFFWGFNNVYLIYDNSINLYYPNVLVAIRNVIGAIVAGLVIAASHNLFHKIRVLGK